VFIFAAASLTDALQEAVHHYRSSHPGVEVVFNFGASGTLARQIRAGAPADLFLSANPMWMDELEREGLIDPGSIRNVLSNALVIVVPRDSTLRFRSPSDLANSEIHRIAIADPAVAPAGAYTRSYLEGKGIWKSIERRVVPTLDVRAALAAVATGAVDCGIVYRTDAATKAGVSIAYSVPPGEEPGIVYSLAVLRHVPGETAALAAFLASPAGLEIFQHHGFLPAPRGGPAPIPPFQPSRTSEWALLWFTIRVAFASTALIFLPGLLLAFALARGRWPGKSLIETLVNIPLVLPPTAVGLLLFELVSRRTIVGSWIHDLLGRDITFTASAVVLATAVMSIPLLIRSARTAFEEVPRRYEEIARTLGRGRIYVFLTITLPLAHRGILAGLVLAFSRALGEFGATMMVAGNIPGRTQTMALAIFHRVQIGDDPGAYRLVALAVVLAFVAIWISGWLTRRRRVSS